MRQLTSPFLLRRTKADKSLVPDLPDKVEQMAWASLTREQAGMYQGVVDQLLADAQQATGMRRRGLVLAALTRLKQICNHPAHALGDGSRLGGRSGKLTRFDELVTDLLDAGEQALVFTQFREMGLLLQRHLDERFALPTPVPARRRAAQGPRPHGRRVPGTARRRRCCSSRCRPAAPASTSPPHRGSCTTTAGGTRRSRTRPPTGRGASARQRSVFVHKLVCQGTIEERVDAMINDKRALADAVVGTTGETWLSELSTDELRDLIVLDHNAVRGT